MKQHRDWQEEMSAQLDGECADPAALAARLAQDPELARTFAQLETVVAQVRRLPEPALHPAFVTRVLAEVREEATPVVVPWWRGGWVPFGMKLAGGFCLLALVASLALRPVETSTDEIAAGAAEGDAYGVVVALEEAGADLALLADDFAREGELDVEELPTDAVDEVFLAMLDAAWSEDELDDLDIIEHMSGEQQDVLWKRLQSGAPLGDQSEG